jgi:hypothetical protein
MAAMMREASNVRVAPRRWQKAITTVAPVPLV